LERLLHLPTQKTNSTPIKNAPRFPSAAEAAAPWGGRAIDFAGAFY
jgi:hypothetical protein